MVLEPQETRFQVTGSDVQIEVAGQPIPVDRVVRAFPQTRPNAYISFLDSLGHEIGILETCEGMDPDSRAALDAHLRKLYFIPTITEILSVETAGTTSRWRVITDDGERTFQVSGRESLDGEKPPKIQVTDAESRKYKIDDYFELDEESRGMISELLPDKILKSKVGSRNSSGMVMRTR